MTIGFTPSYETESLILPLQRTFFPTTIPRQHHQLKNFISTTDPEIIYYASANKVFALRKSTRKTELIADLQWIPQCLDAAYGWVCVGGLLSGSCAFIHVGEDPTSDSTAATQSHTEVDALLPLDLDPESRMLDHQSYLGHRRPAQARRKKPEVHYHELGGCIVNSVTIYQLRGEEPGLRDEVVAILTNNDQTVRIFSLTQSRVLATLQFPTPMNHATLSPNRELLVAVGDVPRAFFCKRLRLPNPGADGQASFANYEWLEIAEPRLSLADSQDACFTTAWSPSGHVCAVASQSGTITVFDTSGIKDDMDADEAVIEVLKASRPSSNHDFCGAVRSMSFAPAPWDLLAWAEDQGRVCVTDLRDAFRSRQTIELDPDSPSLNRASMSEMEDAQNTVEERTMQIEARFLQREALVAHNSSAAINRTADYLELAAQRTAQRRRHLDEGTDSLSEHFGELTERERQTMEAIAISRLQQNEQPGTGSSQRTPYSVEYSHALGTNSTTRQSELSNTNTSSSATPPALPQNYRQMESIREYIRQRSLEHNLERTRTGTRSYQPRRRSSVVISNSNSHNRPSSSHSSSLIPIGQAASTLSRSPSRLASNTANPNANTNANPVPPTFTSTNGDPWQTISDAMALSNTAPSEAFPARREHEEARTPGLERQSIQQRPSEALSRYDRLLRASNPQGHLTASRYDYLSPQTLDSVRALMRDGMLDDEAVARIEANEAMVRPALRSRRDIDGGIGTMGVGWSRDGRNLYVATEEGILEYTVNIEKRKTFPGITLQ